MKMRVDYSDFEAMFKQYNRLNNFPEGLRQLFDYLEDLESDIGTEIELDVIAICCDFHEGKLSVVLSEYSLGSLDELRDNTLVIMVDSESEEDPTIIYQGF